MVLFGGCAVLLLFLFVSGAGVGMWYWKNSPAKKDDIRADGPKDDPPKKPPDDPKKMTLGKASDFDLGVPEDVWEFSLRLPRGATMTRSNKEGGGQGESYHYAWGNSDKTALCTVIKQRHGADKDALTVLSANRHIEYGKMGQAHFTTPHMPQATEINGLAGARVWQSLQNPSSVSIFIEYTFHLDGWAYKFVAVGLGRTEDAARRNADLIDASICTFKKR